MNTKPKVSIITPTRNQGAFIERTIKSIMEQDYPNLEYIIMDGDSTDNTVEIIKKYEDRLAYWESKPDKGQVDAINKGIRRASGDIIAYLNSDDFYYPGAIQRAVDALENQNDSDKKLWYCGAVRFEYEDGSVRNVWCPQLPPTDKGDCVFPGWGGVPQVGCFWRKELFDKVGLFRDDMHYVFDTEFIMRCVLMDFPPLADETEIGVALLQSNCKMQSGWDKFLFESERVIELFKSYMTKAQYRRSRMWAMWSLAHVYRKERRWGKSLQYFLRLLLHMPVMTTIRVVRTLAGLERAASRSGDGDENGE